MRTLVITSLLLVSGCHSELQSQQTEQNRELRIQAWQSCIDSGGAPIESWVGAPAMERCDYKEQGDE
jgi:hypothetical protein